MNTIFSNFKSYINAFQIKKKISIKIAKSVEKARVNVMGRKIRVVCLYFCIIGNYFQALSGKNLVFFYKIEKIRRSGCCF